MIMEEVYAKGVKGEWFAKFKIAELFTFLICKKCNKWSIFRIHVHLVQGFLDLQGHTFWIIFWIKRCIIFVVEYSMPNTNA
jgi:hypothetical protein